MDTLRDAPKTQKVKPNKTHPPTGGQLLVSIRASPRPWVCFDVRSKNSMLLATSIGIGLLSAAIALTGILISLGIAIYGDDIRSICRRPKLCLTLPDECGEWTVLRGGDPAIYFHALVRNCTPARVANAVELFVTECTVTPRDGTPERQPLPCPLPIQARREFHGMRHHQIDVGAAPFAYDLFLCRGTKHVLLLLNCNYPNNFKPKLTGPGTMSITIQALGINASSNKVFVQIEWDSIFPDKDSGLAPHLTITHKTT